MGTRPAGPSMKETDMIVLLLNAGSSSLKCTFMEAVNRRVIAHGLADWAGSVTHYQTRARTVRSSSEEVSYPVCSGHLRRPAAVPTGDKEAASKI